MVDGLKKQMRRFENLIGFEGKLDVTSRESVETLMDALSLKYKVIRCYFRIILTLLHIFNEIARRANI